MPAAERGSTATYTGLERQTRACANADKHPRRWNILFRCTKCDTQRESMRQVAQSKMGNLPFFVGGKDASDGPKWAPNLQAVRAAIRFALETKRLDTNHAG
jgi:hypothetical protein